MILKEALGPLRQFFSGRQVLDFGASRGLSTYALIEMGARSVVAAEPDRERAAKGLRIGRELGVQKLVPIVIIPYDANLPFADSSFEMVMANAVLEHIPSARAAYVRELWRVLRPGGHLIIRESPNKYLPIDLHTTNGLWFVPWMPKNLARRYAVWRGRFRPEADWNTSGWRGIGYYEIRQGLSGPYKLIPETDRLRHRLLTRFGLPASLFDPYPTLVFQKKKSGE